MDITQYRRIVLIGNSGTGRAIVRPSWEAACHPSAKHPGFILVDVETQDGTVVKD